MGLSIRCAANVLTARQRSPAGAQELHAELYRPNDFDLVVTLGCNDAVDAWTQNPFATVIRDDVAQSAVGNDDPAPHARFGVMAREQPVGNRNLVKESRAAICTNVGRQTRHIAILAIKFGAEHRVAALRAEHPGPQLPWRTMPNMLRMTTVKPSDPVAVVVLPKAGNLPVGHRRAHDRTPRLWPPPTIVDLLG